MNRELETSSHDENVSPVKWTMWKRSEMAVQSNVSCLDWSLEQRTQNMCIAEQVKITSTIPRLNLVDYKKSVCLMNTISDMFRPKIDNIQARRALRACM